MAAPLSVSNANVQPPDGAPLMKVRVLVRGSTLTIQARGNGAELARDETVRTVVKRDRRTWEVTTDAGVFVVAQLRGCGCGR